ncbi:MAG: DUF952 domain-containing protein [Myxococcales bacterium]|nr:DUF952 domain-containing protein [Myxococcales bacterium]
MNTAEQQRLFHIARRSDWQRALDEGAGAYRVASLESQGFIHLSIERQWRGVLETWFAGERDLLLLEIDAARVTHEVRFEPADGDHFPHLYGPLAIDAVVSVRELR